MKDYRVQQIKDENHHMSYLINLLLIKLKGEKHKVYIPQQLYFCQKYSSFSF